MEREDPESHTIRPEATDLDRQAQPLGDGVERKQLHPPLSEEEIDLLVYGPEPQYTYCCYDVTKLYRNRVTRKRDTGYSYPGESFSNFRFTIVPRPQADADWQQLLEQAKRDQELLQPGEEAAVQIIFPPASSQHEPDTRPLAIIRRGKPWLPGHWRDVRRRYV